MGTEIERKFLVCGEPWKDLGIVGMQIVQGYLSTERARTVRVRICGDDAYITIKAPLAEHEFARSEYEYAIPFDEAQLILNNLAKKPLIEKVRYHIPCAEMTWDVDVFLGENAGLVLAEIELNSEGQSFVKPTWLGEEVTNDRRYLNSSLSIAPYLSWITKETNKRD